MRPPSRPRNPAPKPRSQHATAQPDGGGPDINSRQYSGQRPRTQGPDVPAGSAEIPEPEKAPVRKISSQQIVAGSRPQPRPREQQNTLSRASENGVGELGNFEEPRVPILSTGLADRLAERKAIASTLKRRKLMWVTGILALLGVAGWGIFYSPAMALDLNQVTVNGAHTYVTKDQVLEAISPFEGTPLATISMNKVHNSVGALGNVRDVVQTRKWPRGLTITVEERVPVAAVPQDGKFVLMDMDAVIVARQEEPPPELPLIELALSKGTEKTLGSVLQILEHLPSEFLAEVKTIAAASQDSVNLTLRDGIVVHWGSSEETPLKLEVLSVLLPTAQKDGTRMIDLSAPTFPITK